MTTLSTRIAAAAATIAAAFALTTATASAEKIANFSSGGWKGGAYTNRQSGNFSHCAATARYKSGVTLVFSVTGGRQWYMGFARNSWGLRPGTKYPVRFQVDNGPVLKAAAKAKTQKVVEVFLPPRDNLFRSFRNGGELKVLVGRKRMAFNLTGVDRMLAKLYRCATHYAKRHGNDPFANTGRDPFTTQSKRDPFATRSSRAGGQEVAGSSFF
ncbi:MAG: hypothetical protein AAF441_26480 [Pseudomonadota bacterium]